MFYFKLAWSNIKKNRPTYFPFLVSISFLVFLNLLMQVLLNNPGMQTMPQAFTVRSMFGFGAVVIVIFSVIFAFYTNSFLIKRRQKELGLYNILGMDKKSLGWMLLIESLISLVITLIVGLGLGSIISKFLFLILKKMTGFGSEFIFQISPSMLFFVIVPFIAIFALLLVYNFAQLLRTNPIELLHGGESGEKEPKAHWILTVLGLLCVATGYAISLIIESPIDALTYFFIAIVLVVIGTYLIMITASVTILKFLRGRPKLYYRPKPFINISGMIYRMKQNGAGLASICILSTMVLVTVSSTAGLFFGREDVLRTRNPTDFSLSTQAVQPDLETRVQEIAAENNLEVTDSIQLNTPDFGLLKLTDGHFSSVPVDTQDFNGIVSLNVWTLADFQNLTGETKTLQDDEVLLYPVSGEYQQETMIFGNNIYHIKEQLLEEIDILQQNTNITDAFVLFVKDEQAIQTLYDSLALTDEIGPLHFDSEVLLNVSGTEAERQNFTSALYTYQDELNNQHSADALSNPNMPYASASSIETDREETNSFTAGFLFLGIIFGLSFTVATALIIYYKQISEGYQDAQRFEIMQKVGMSHKEVRRTILSQILMVFLFPITLAVIHLAFAMPIIRKLLLLFGLTNDNLITLMTIISVAVFALCYLLVYWQTSKVYYRIVERKV